MLAIQCTNVQDKMIFFNGNCFLAFFSATGPPLMAGRSVVQAWSCPSDLTWSWDGDRSYPSGAAGTGAWLILLRRLSVGPPVR